MTEAEDDLKDAFDFCLDLYYRQDQHTPMYGVILDCLDELKQYRALGTIEELREAMEKQIAKPHHHTKVGNINDSVRVSICPSCLGLIYTHREEYPNYCNSCGQKISWKDSEV